MDDRTPYPAFPIVGIGASAGSFSALAALLRHLPAAPGMAFVVVLHLPADQDSKADRVLQGWSSLPVVQVNHAVPLLPDQVYVISPGRMLKMQDGYLVLAELDRAPGDPRTIDVFFRTLAAAHREKAVGVVLSGMGADGTAGLAAIREQGGVAIVQAPAEAEQASMPQAAIDAGMADFVLPAAGIPAKLLELSGILHAIRDQAQGAHAPMEACFDMGPDPQRTLDAVLALLHERTGHDFRQYKRATLLRRMERRLQLRNVRDLPGYRDLLRKDAGEAQALLKDLLIGVTQFFRDRDAFAALEREVVPHIFAGKQPVDSVRVWVAACSTGEEAYSVAMLLADQAARAEHAVPFQVFASDIDADAIRTARAGVYPAAIADDVPPERLQRYFTQENGAYKVRKALRDRMLFAEHNLLHDPAFSALDLITCRNFLIYLNREMHRHVLGMFHFVLHPGAYLMLGGAESVDEAPHLFAAADAAQRIYRAMPASSSGMLPVAAPARQPPAPMPAAPDEPPSPMRRSRLFSFADIHLHKVAELAPPSILLDANGDIVHIAEKASRFLRLAGGEPTRELVALVPPDLRLGLRTALFQAQKSGEQAVTGPVRYRQDGEQRAVDMTVQPFRDEHAEGMLLLVYFREVADVVPAPADARDRSLLEELGDELQQTRRKLRETIDQAERSGAALRVTVEELQASVQEQRAANDELRGGREQQRSANEEQATAIGELDRQLKSLAKAHDDLNNLVASSGVATLFLDRNMRILRYTPRITELFNVIPADVGRPLLHITNRLDRPQLAEDAARVFQTLQSMEQEVRSKDGRYYIVRAHPYRTRDDRIDGAVMTFFDITERRAAEEALREASERRAFLLAFSDALRAEPDEDAIKRRTVDMVALHLRADRCWISEVYEEEGCSTVGPERIRPDLPPMTGVFRLADYPETMLQLATQPMIVEDASGDPRFPEPEKKLLAGLHLRSLLVVPLRKGLRHVIWALAVAMATPRRWNDGERMLLEEVAERAWTAAERARAEATLRESEERYRTLFETMGQGYCHLELVRDAGGRVADLVYLELNPAFERIFGIPVDQAVGRKARDVFPELEPWWTETFDRIAQSGRPERVCHEMASLGRWYEVSVYPRGGDRLVVLYDEVKAGTQPGAGSL